MLEELVVRMRSLDRAALVRAVVIQLRMHKEDLGPAQVEEHIEIAIAEPKAPGYFTAKPHRLTALRKAIEELEREQRPRTDEPRPRTEDLPPIDPAALRIRLRGLPQVVVGLPQLDRALLDDAGDRSYAWLEAGAVVAVGPAQAAIADACRPYPVARPAWQQLWVEHTGGDANPWRPPTDADLHAWFHAALERTFGDGYHGRHPLAALRLAFDEWARADARDTIARLTAPAAGEARAIDAAQLARALGALPERNGALPSAALVPLVLAELARHGGVEIWPTPPGLHLDVIGRAATGYVQARAVKLRGQAAAWRPLTGDGVPRDTRVFEGGNVVLSLSNL